MVGSNEAGVVRVMSFGSSSRVYPTASLAAIRAIGKPVAFDARADERDTRGFISMTTIRPVTGSTANWMFEPPVSTPISRMQAIAASRMRWYSRSVRVCAGATVIESPVCTPIGSKFSIEQTTTTLSRRSRITSSSYSFQPAIDSSTSTSPIMLASMPRPASSSSPRASCATPPPEPPRVKEGRMMTGKPRSAAAARASSRLWARPLRGTSRPIACIAALNSLRSSALRIASRSAPMRRTPWRSSTPRSASWMARLRPVWPPRVGRSASGFSRAMIFSSIATVIGSM